MTTNNAPIVSIFDERGNAERAIEDLYNAGVPSDQISYSGGSTPASNGGGFLDSIKNLFAVGHDRTATDVLDDLNNMGIPQDEAEYYAQQYDAGRTIVAIQQETLNQNALTILRSNGGYDYQGNWNRASENKFVDLAASTETADNNQTSDTSAASNRNFAGTEAGTYNQANTNPAFTSQRRYTDTADTTTDNTHNQDIDNADSTYQQNPANTYNQNVAPSDAIGRQDYTGATDISDAPTSVNRQTYADPSQQGFNAAPQDFNTPNQQAYADPNQQGFNNPNNAGQQAYTDPASYNQNVNDPAYTNQQTYTDPTQSTNTYNQTTNPNQQGFNNPNATGQQTYTDSTQSANAYNQDVNASQNQVENPHAPHIRSDRDGVNRTPDQDYAREQRNTTDQNNS